MSTIADVAKLDREELAWAAGFFDGEGCATFSGRRVAIQVGQNDRRPLERFRAALGIGTIYGPYRHASKPNFYYRWSCQSWANVHLVTWLLWRFLSEPKREQLHASLERMNAQQRGET